MKKSRLSQRKQEKLQELFVAGVTARTAAELADVHRNTATYYFHRLRVLIMAYTDKQSRFKGEAELDESYFGGHRKGQRGRGATGKVPISGILKRGGKGYTKVISDVRTQTLLPVIEEKFSRQHGLYRQFCKFNVLDVSDFKYRF